MNFKIKNVFVKRVLIIFLIGLVSRIGVNIVYGIDMFKDFNSSIELVSYAVMVSCSVVVYELPEVNFNVFNFKVVNQVITEFCKDGFGVKQKVTLGGGDVDSTKQNVQGKEGLVFCSRNSAGLGGLYSNGSVGSSRPSAGVRGLYEGETSRNRSSRTVSGQQSRVNSNEVIGYTTQGSSNTAYNGYVVEWNNVPRVPSLVSSHGSMISGRSGQTDCSVIEGTVLDENGRSVVREGGNRHYIDSDRFTQEVVGYQSSSYTSSYTSSSSGYESNRNSSHPSSGSESSPQISYSPEELRISMYARSEEFRRGNGNTS